MIFRKIHDGVSRRALPLCLALVLLGGPLAAKPPKINTVRPLAAVPGKTTELVITGEGLETATGLWTSFGSKSSIIAGEKRDGKSLRIKLSIPAETPVGIGAIRLAGPGGLSNLELFLIDGLAVRTVSEDNTSAATAISLEPPCAIDSQAKAEHRDFYSFKARAGQSLSFEVMSQRIGSALDPVLRILDADGRELAFSDDAAGADSRLAWRAEKDGEYLIELRDITYRGGESFSYRLRVGDFPLVSAPYPMRAEQAKKTKVTIAGESSAGVEPREVQLPGGSHGRAFSLAARRPGGRSSSFVTILSSDLPELLENEPNNQSESAARVSHPCAINGRFSSKGDRDYYSITGKKGDRILIRGETRLSGSPTDLYLRLEKPGGGKITDAEDQSYDPGKDKQKGKNYYFDEGSIDHTFTEDGVVILMVEDLTGRGGPEHVYRIEVRPSRGRFSLELSDTLYHAPAGGDFKVKVHCRRNGYDGPIELEAAGLPPGTKAAKARIDKGKTSAELSISLGKDLQPGFIGTFRIFTTIQIGEGAERLEAGTREALRKDFPRLFHPPRVLDGLAGFAVTARKK